MLPGRLFGCPITWANIRKTQWPAQAGDSSHYLEEQTDQEAAEECVFWRKNDRCNAHPEQKAHACWGKSTVEGLLREDEPEGTVPEIPEVPPLPVLEKVTPLLAAEWRRQTIFICKVRELYLACLAAGDGGKEKWEDEQPALHERTWPGSYEVQGLPPKDCEALRAWRTVKPETRIDAKMRPVLEEILLRDFPKGATIPPHIATWLSTSRRSFEGVDPRFLHCFYHLGVPDLVYTREVVAAHRMARLGDILAECLAGKTIRIAKSWADLVTPRKAFKGQTTGGLNQVVVGALGIQGVTEVLNKTMIWCAASYGGEWSSHYTTLPDEGKLSRSSYLTLCSRR